MADFLPIMKSFESMARGPSAKRSLMLKDDSVLSTLALVLCSGAESAETVGLALEILVLLSEKAESLTVLRASASLQAALGKLGSAGLDEKTSLTLATVRGRMEGRASAPLRSLQTSTDGFNVSGGEGKRRHAAPSFMGRRTKVPSVQLKLRIRGLLSPEAKDDLQRRLLRLGGIVSIYIDGSKDRVVLRVRSDFDVSGVGGALVGFDAAALDRVRFDEDGAEIFEPLCDEKENVPPKADAPSYLNESFGNSPKAADGALARTGKTAQGGRGGWFGGIGNFISENLYW